MSTRSDVHQTLTLQSAGVCGYAHALYVRSLCEFGRPRHLAESGGWLLERDIPGSRWRDAMGCYPLFACEDYSRLAQDLQRLEDLVSVSVVADPFGNFNLSGLQACFDRATLFKQHYVVSLEGDLESTVSKHHRYYARRALRQISVERCPSPMCHLDEWVDLYSHLAARHALRGIKRFSRDSFEQLMCVPGIVMLRARVADRTVGAHLWLLDQTVGYSHLMALSAEGYSLAASYALYGEAICRSAELLSPNLRVLNLGAGAGVGGTASDGLSKFKRGWASGTKPVYFCSRVLNPDAYARLAAADSAAAATQYFPAYRRGELT